ncbi:hypothetical protein F4776DRAFT_667071 [Hypoxylon sp. NC0597]|nr:hypothetical protein F4776DRAFT_667071 [Hypoxylon sp. NC0597]
MQFTSFIAAAAALAFGASASGVAERDGARLAQFRVFGATGCHDQNFGFYTVDASDLNACKTFTGLPAGSSIKSLNLEAQYSPAADGCSFFIYTDGNCQAGRRSIASTLARRPPTPAPGLRGRCTALPATKGDASWTFPASAVTD